MIGFAVQNSQAPMFPKYVALYSTLLLEKN
jgi:hypothetical protein